MSVSIEFLITGILITGALAYLGRFTFRNVRSMSAKEGCKADCGCSENSHS